MRLSSLSFCGHLILVHIESNLMFLMNDDEDVVGLTLV